PRVVVLLARRQADRLRLGRCRWQRRPVRDERRRQRGAPDHPDPAVGQRARLGGGLVRALTLAVAVLLATITAIAAGAAPRQSNGLIAFAKFNPALGDTQIYLVAPDGSGELLLSSDPPQCPTWSPDGRYLSS